MGMQYVQGRFTGPMVVAKIVDTVGIILPGEYTTRCSTEILTGPNNIRGRDCLVSPRLNAYDIKPGKQLVVRLNMPEIRGQYRNFLFGNSVTGEVPEDFEYAEPPDVLLWSPWLEGMDGQPLRRGCDYFPTMEDVNGMFHIGEMFRTFCIRDVNGDGTPVCYQLYGRGGYRLIREDPHIALADYMRGMSTDGSVWTSTPRVMTMDEVFVEGLPADKLLDPKSIGVEHCIRMDPPPRFQHK